MIEINKVYQGDCLEVMKQIDDKSVDMILCDLPYGVTQNPEDKIIDMQKLWEQYNRVIKEDGVIVLTSQFPFTIDLINSNRKMFKYDLIWNKVLSSGFLNANRMPLRVHEHILIFYNKLGTYNPQKIIGQKNHSKGKEKKNANNNYGAFGFVDNKDVLGELKHPQSIITVQKTHPSIALHRTEKPVELAEYLIKTYTNEGDVVLDNCIGSGWTAVASLKTKRSFIGIELRNDFVEICLKRIMEVKSGCNANDNGIPPNNKLLGILPTIL